MQHESGTLWHSILSFQNNGVVQSQMGWFEGAICIAMYANETTIGPIKEWVMKLALSYVGRVNRLG